MTQTSEKPGDITSEVNRDPFVYFLTRIIGYNVRFLAALMVIVIIWSSLDVVVHVYRQLTSIETIFNVENLISLLGAFLAVLIAIEIFLNIIFYLREDAIHVPLVIATALTAVARKVIIIDYTTMPPLTIFAMGTVIFALGISYWLTVKKS